MQQLSTFQVIVSSIFGGYRYMEARFENINFGIRYYASAQTHYNFLTSSSIE
jgi:hypothetical protein